MSEYLWKGYRRIFGRYISHEYYELSQKYLKITKGILFFKKEKIVPLYKVRDVIYKQSFLQKRMSVGSLEVYVVGGEHVTIKNICNSLRVKKILTKLIQQNDTFTWDFKLL